MSVDPTPVAPGDTFRTPDGTTINILRVDEDSEWADIHVIHRCGTVSWPPRISLADGCLPYPADLVAGVSL